MKKQWIEIEYVEQDRPTRRLVQLSAIRSVRQMPSGKAVLVLDKNNAVYSTATYEEIKSKLLGEEK